MTSAPTLDLDFNVNPLIFENLATSLATALAHMNETGGELTRLYDVYESVFRKTRKHALNYLEVTELAGEGSNPNDRCAGRGAWTLMNTERLDVQAVHTNIWERLPGKRVRFGAPFLHFLAKKLNVELSASVDELAELGANAHRRKVGKLGVLGVRNGEIWVVETISNTAFEETRDLFRTKLFDDPMLSGRHLVTLQDIYLVLSKCFPSINVVPLVLVTHTQRPHHFELYRPRLGKTPAKDIVLSSDMIIDTSLNHADRLDDDNEAFWKMPGLIDNDLFLGLPPCRGSRTLGLLAAVAKKQIEHESLLIWTEKELGDLYRETFGYAVSRDKVRHDIGDRLIAQWFMKRRGDIHFLTIQGMSRYLYSLAKYTTCGPDDHMDILDKCLSHSYKLINKFRAV